MPAALNIPDERPSASTVKDFLRRNGIGRTKFYSEVGAGRLRVVRCGGRTLVLDEDAEAWRRSLPAISVRIPETKTAGRL